MKKAGSLFGIALIALAITLALIACTAVRASEEELEITNIRLTPDGILTWDAVEGTGLYWIGVNGGYTPDEPGMNLMSRISISTNATYTVAVEAFKPNDGPRFARSEFEVSCINGSFVMGSYCAAGGWWDTSGPYVEYVKLNGKEIAANEVMYFDEQGEALLTIKPKDGYELNGVFLRYHDENNTGPEMTLNEDGEYEGRFETPNEVFMIGIDTMVSTPSFGTHVADFIGSGGVLREGYTKGDAAEAAVNVCIRTGNKTLPTANMYLKAQLTSGDTAAFSFQEFGNYNLADVYGTYSFYVYPAPGLAAGEYNAVLTLFYDANGEGKNWEEIDICDLTLTVFEKKTQVFGSFVCTEGADKIADIKRGSDEFNAYLALKPGDPIELAARPAAGYVIEKAELQYAYQTEFGQVTLAGPDANGVQNISFTVPEDDFVLLLSVKKDAGTTYVTYDPGDGIGEMEAEYLPKSGFTLPEPQFAAPEGKQFDGWQIWVRSGDAAWSKDSILNAGANFTTEFDYVKLTAQWKAIDNGNTDPPATGVPATAETATDKPNDPENTESATQPADTETPTEPAIVNTPETNENKKESKGNGALIAVVIILAVLLAAAIAVITVLLLKKRKKA